MRSKLLLSGAVVAVLAFASQARAEVIAFGFSGAGGSGSGLLTVTPDTVVGDPTGAYTITGISGTFSDQNIGVSNAAITGLVPINPVNPPVGAPAPVSLSYLFVTNPPPNDSSISYDNLFYPDGSPITCAGYPFSGGFLDVYGALFTVDNGDVVDLWSNGELPGVAPLTYGFAVVNGSALIDYQSTGVSMAVPEPGSIWLLGTGLFLALAWRRTTAATGAAFGL